MDPDAPSASPPTAIPSPAQDLSDGQSAHSATTPAQVPSDTRTGDDNFRPPHIPLATTTTAYYLAPMTTPPTPIPHQLEIPTLTFSNFIPWRISVEHFARSYNVLQYLLQPTPSSTTEAEANLHITNHSQAQLLVLPTLSPEIMALFTDAELSGPILSLIHI